MVHDRTKTFNKYARVIVKRTKKYIHYISIHAYALNIISIHIYIYDIYLRTSYRTVINSST